MQKIKSALTGHSESTTDRASRDYSTGHNDPIGSRTPETTGNGSGYNTNTTGSSGLTNSNTTGDRLTGDQAARTGDRLTGDHTASVGDRLTGDRTATGTTAGNRSSVGTTGSGSGGLIGSLTDRHREGHDPSLASKFDPSAETTHHDHKHLAHVTQRDVRHIETEEVERQRELERHVHHVQHHVQPVLDKQVNDEVLHENKVPVTKIREQHVNNADDIALFQGLGSKHQDSETHRGKERTVIDLGEKVNETVHHHVHHITQPVVQQEVHDRHRIHTVIPSHHVTHEAPIIHKSSVHEPIGINEFKKGGGVLGSDVTLNNSGVLQTGECVREVDGVGEKLAQELRLGGSSHHGSTGTTGTSGVTGSGSNSAI